MVQRTAGLKTVFPVAAVLALLAALALTQLSQPPGVRVQASTTTSLYATGLLDYLLQEYHRAGGKTSIEFIAVGSGQALRLAEKGDVCMVFVHAPSLEKKYLDEGVIEPGGIFAYNYFVIVGPAGDPAGVRGAKSAVEAFKRIMEAGERGQALFVSRGDMSGTHVRELMIWRLAGVDPAELRGKPWYIETGQGMAKTLIVAYEKGAYTLSDIGTYLKLRREGRIPGLEALYTNSTELINVYSVYLVKSCSGSERRAAEEFARFVLEHQELIARYGVDEYGSPLFYPARGRLEELKKIWEILAEGRLPGRD